MAEWQPEERRTDCMNCLKGGPCEISLAQAMRAERARELDAAACVDECTNVFVLHADMVAMDKAWDPVLCPRHAR
jgi:hypothetical protein